MNGADMQKGQIWTPPVPAGAPLLDPIWFEFARHRNEHLRDKAIATALLLDRHGLTSRARDERAAAGEFDWVVSLLDLVAIDDGIERTKRQQATGARP